MDKRDKIFSIALQKIAEQLRDSRSVIKEKQDLISLFNEAQNTQDLILNEKKKKLTKQDIKDLLEKAKPIKHGKDIVGFTTPTTTLTGIPRLGNIYIKRSERGKGYGYAAAKEFVDANKEVAWFANEKNQSSINLAKKLGLIYTQRAKGRPHTMIFEKKAAEFAPGLPSKERVDPIAGNTGPTRLVVQRHKATSDHYDYRLVEGDVAHSWVGRSLPGEKDKMLMIRQPTHTVDYLEFEGDIPKGTYGAGSVKKVYDAPADILESSNSRIRIVIPEGEFTMIKMKPKGKQENWLMVKNKNTIPNPITSKPNFKDIGKKELNFDDPTKVWQPKVDGGHTIFRLHSNAPNRIYSYRTSKKSGLPIEHTHQVPDLRDAEIPKDLDGVELRGELYAKERSGKPMPAESVAGLLNANVMKSREQQGERGKLIPYIFDIIKGPGGEDVRNMPYSKKYDLIKLVEKKVPAFRAADVAITREQKQEMFNRIQQKKHPDTVEGIVEWDLTAPGGDPKKYKIRDTHEVIIRNIFPAESKKPTPFAGGFEYSWESEGPIVGRVGTGFSQKMREEMVANPKKFIGRVARIKTQQVFGSGAARAPSFYSMHVEKNLEKAAEEKYKSSLYELGAGLGAVLGVGASAIATSGPLYFRQPGLLETF